MRISFELSTGVATIGLAGYRLVGESLRGTSREGRFLRNVEENTLVIVDSYPVFAEDGAARTAPHSRRNRRDPSGSPTETPSRPSGTRIRTLGRFEDLSDRRPI